MTVCMAMMPHFSSELIFPAMHKHNHGSCIVECPNGDLLACWYRGAGEKSADDVAIYASRRKRDGKSWTEPIVIADTPGFPDCNPCMIVDPRKRLWLFYPTILDNHWESAITKYKVSRSYQRPGAPVWEVSEDLPLKPGPDFKESVDRDLRNAWQPFIDAADPARQMMYRAEGARLLEAAGVKLSVRLGWMPRAHPTIIEGHRILLPLYSDLFDFSLVAITDDWGATWQCSAPMIGAGNVQPSIVQRKDGELVAFFRNNGPPPNRVQQSESRDGGLTWSIAHRNDLPNPGAGVEATKLRDGRWLFVGNNTEDGRHNLAVWVSEDEGRTWPHMRQLEHHSLGDGGYSYPSIIEASDGTIHVTYSHSTKAGESIKHVEFNMAWLMAENERR